MAIASSPPPVLPAPVQRRLARLRRRVRGLQVARGLGNLALVVAALALLGMAADVAWELPLGARWGIWAALITGATLALLAGVALPLARRIGWLDLAALAESDAPSLGERLSSAVALAESGSRAHGAPALIARVVDDAARSVHALDPRRIVPPGRASGRLAVGATVLGLLVLPALLRPEPFARLWERLLAPWRDVERVSRYLVAIRGGNRIVALGDDVSLVADIRPRFGETPAPDTAHLQWTDAKGQRHTVPMTPDLEIKRGVRTWRVTMPRVAASFAARVVSGSASSRAIQIRALPAPSIARIQARVEPPAYTRLPARDLADARQVEAFEGSTVRLELTASQPLAAARLLWPEPAADTTPPKASSKDSEPPARTIELDRVDSTGLRWRAAAPAWTSGRFGLALVDRDGLRSRADMPRQLSVRPDRAPSVALSGDAPNGPEEAQADDVLTVGFTARDDIAIAAAALEHVVERAGSAAPEEPGRATITSPTLGQPRARGQARLELQSLGLKTGDRVRYRVRVEDNRPAPRGPNVAYSDVREIQIVAKADALAARRSAADRARIQDLLNALKKAATENRQATEQLRYAADAAQRNPASWDAERRQALRDRESSARELVDRLNLFAREVQRDPTFHPLADPARQIAHVEAEAGREALDQARQAEEPAQRLESLKQADSRQAAVQGRLDELQRAFDQINRRGEDRQRLAALAERQEALARRTAEAAQGAVPDRARLDQLRVEQNRLNQELEQVFQRSPELRAEALAGRAAETAALAQRARDLADQQRDQARQTGELSNRAQELRALAEEQQALEADARRLALDVNSPLTENGRGALNAQALAQPVDPLRRAELEQARTTLESAENELRRLARDLDEVPDDPRALAQRLLRRQEALRNQAQQVLRETVADRNRPRDEEMAALAERLEPLRARQEAIGKLVAALPVPRPQVDARKQAVERQEQAASGLKAAEFRELENRQNQALESLRGLANALPDPAQRGREARQRFEQARQRTEQVANELERHLRETARQPGQPFNPDESARQLADRLAGLAEQQAQVAAELQAADAPARLDPQRQRAAARAEALAEALARVDRAALPGLVRDARAGIARLLQKHDGQAPAEEVAAELAAEARALATEATTPPERRAAEARRLAAALRGLQAPDAPLAQNEAVRAAEAATEAAGRPDAAAARAALESLGAASDRLVARLEDRLPAAETAAQLARAERVQNGPTETARTAQAQAEAQQAIAEELARAQAREATPGPLPEADPRRAAERQAAAQVDRAVELARGLARPDLQAAQGTAPPTPEALAEARDQAASALDQLAQALGAQPAPAQIPPPPDPANARQRAQELAQQQRALAQQLEQVQREAEQAPDKNAARAQLSEKLAPLAARQRALDEATARIGDPRPASDQARTEAARRREAAQVSQDRAQSAMARRDPAQAAQLAGEAAGRLEQLTQALPEQAPEPDPAAAPVPADPELAVADTQVAAARELTQRQRRIRERLQALAADRIAPQDNLRDAAQSLGQQFAQLRDELQPVSPRSRGPSAEAAELLQNQGPRQMEQGTTQLARGQVHAARESQRQASALLERAAQRAEDLAEALRSEAPPEAASSPTGPALAQAQLAQQAAREQLAQARDPGRGARSAQQAAQSMQQAAEGLRTAALAGQPGEPGEGTPQPGDPQLAEGENGSPREPGDPLQPTQPGTNPTPESAPAGTAEAELAALKEQIQARTGRAWGELPGHLRTEILQMAQGRYRDDYARLIQLYFREIAAGAEGRPAGAPRPTP